MSDQESTAPSVPPDLGQVVSLSRPTIVAVPNRSRRGGAVYHVPAVPGVRPRGRQSVHVTGSGHWLLTGDAAGRGPLLCRGCGRPVDMSRCLHPAAHQDVASALLGCQAVAA